MFLAPAPKPPPGPPPRVAGEVRGIPKRGKPLKASGAVPVASAPAPKRELLVRFLGSGVSSGQESASTGIAACGQCG